MELIYLLLFIIGLGIFFIWAALAVIHCWRNPQTSQLSKILWTLFIILTFPTLGFVVYSLFHFKGLYKILPLLLLGITLFFAFKAGFATGERVASITNNAMEETQIESDIELQQ